MFRYILFLFFFSFNIIIAQNFTVQLSDNIIGLNDSFEISFILDDKGSNFSPPPFSDNFNVLSGPNRSSSTRIVNGKMTQESSYTYVLKAKKVGVFTIMPANIKVKGKTIGTRPVTIQVKKGTSSQKSNTPHNIAARKIHLDVKSNKSACYVGEPIVLTYTLYFNLNVGSLSPKKIKYSGFWTELVDVKSETKQSSYKGQTYNSAVIKQIVLVPQSKGQKSIENLSVDLVASIPSNRRDFFGMLSSQNIDFTVTSNDLFINVLELPSEGKPLNFSGAVGTFKLDFNLNKDTIHIDESVSVEVKVSGNGNLNLLSSPKIDIHKELEVYDPQNSDNIIISSRGIKGYKKDNYLIVPRYKGVYDIGPIDFTYFDPKKKKYISLKSDKKQLYVMPSQFEGKDVSTQTNFNKEKIEVINKDIKFIKTDYSTKSWLSVDFLKSTLFVILLLLPFIVLFLALLYRYDYINLNTIFPLDVLNEVDKRLNSARSLSDSENKDALYSLLLEILFFYLSKKFGIDTVDLNSDRIKKTLTNCNIKQQNILECMDLITKFESYKYSANKNNIGVNSKELVNQVYKVINEIDKQI